jgi:hypothetical protein
VARAKTLAYAFKKMGALKKEEFDRKVRTDRKEKGIKREDRE